MRNSSSCVTKILISRWGGCRKDEQKMRVHQHGSHHTALAPQMGGEGRSQEGLQLEVGPGVPLDGSRRIGPRTIGPRTVGPRAIGPWTLFGGSICLEPPRLLVIIMIIMESFTAFNIMVWFGIKLKSKYFWNKTPLKDGDVKVDSWKGGWWP